MPRRRKSDPFYKDYDPKFHPKDLIELMSTGKLNIHAWTKWDISEATFYRWRQEHPELEEAYQRALPKCEVWWFDNVFQKMIEGEIQGKHSFNAAMAIANAKFGYRQAADGGSRTTNISINNMNVLDKKTSAELLEKIQSDINFLEQNNIIEAEYKTLPDGTSESNE